MFLINSRLGQSAAALQSFESKSLHLTRHPFFRSYGAIMPSSLTTVPPIASVCSTCPPVSVLVRALFILTYAVFLESRDSAASSIKTSSHISTIQMAYFTTIKSTCFHVDVQNHACISFFVTAYAQTHK